MEIRYWKLPDDEVEEGGTGFGWNYCRKCWEDVKRWQLEDRDWPAPEFDE